MANADANLEVSPEAAARKARSSLGGFARAASLTPSQRAKIAKRGGSAGALTRSECKHEGTVRYVFRYCEIDDGDGRRMTRTKVRVSKPPKRGEQLYCLYCDRKV